jgi:hypothetical protein
MRILTPILHVGTIGDDVVIDTPAGRDWCCHPLLIPRSQLLLHLTAGHLRAINCSDALAQAELSRLASQQRDGLPAPLARLPHRHLRSGQAG